MDATTRWETEALRAGDGAHTRPPTPSGMSRSRTSQSNAAQSNIAQSNIAWVTLKEAEAATGIPVNTLRKWVRKTDLPSYLESDGDISLRMVDLDAVEARAKELGREMQPTTISKQSTGDEPAVAPETMIVPVDAWNKMLSQLGNLHEAGQQLADARERAGKAETEVAFLRERLAGIRAEQSSGVGRQATESPQSPSTGEIAERIELAENTDQSSPQGGLASDASQKGPSTTYWRYLTTGWRERRRRHSGD